MGAFDGRELLADAGRARGYLQRASSVAGVEPVRAAGLERPLEEVEALDLDRRQDTDPVSARGPRGETVPGK